LGFTLSWNRGFRDAPPPPSNYINATARVPLNETQAWVAPIGNRAVHIWKRKTAKLQADPLCSLPEVTKLAEARM
jgi:hypothetical protein